MNNVKVGIEKIRVYPCSMALDMKELCKERNHPWEDLRDVMLIDERAVCPPWEDPVTIAVNAAAPMLTEQDKQDIELIIVCSESGVDQEKPMSTWVHRHCGIQPRCRNFEAKHACYSGTGAMHLAASWLVSGIAGPKAKALVVTSDLSRKHFHKPYEFVMGGGATAMLISRDPRFFEIELGKSAIYTNEVSDLTRPTLIVEQGNSETSLLSYIDAVESTVSGYIEKVSQMTGERVTYDYFKKNIYHMPFGGMTVRASRAALRQFGSYKKAEADAIWEQKTKKSLTYSRRMGGTYAGSTFIGMLGMIDNSEDIRPGDRFGVFSYGSGCCAEFYSGLVGYDAKAVAREAGLRELQDSRYKCSVREYEEADRERTLYTEVGDFQPATNGYNDLYKKRYEGSGLLVYKGMHDYYRQYARA